MAFKARTVFTRTSRPAVTDARGPGRPVEVGGETITGTMGIHQGERQEVEYVKADGSKGKAEIGCPPQKLLDMDHAIVETLTLGPWPGSAVHRHMSKAEEKARIERQVREGTFFTETEIQAQRWREVMDTDKDARVAYYRSQGLNKEQAIREAERRTTAPLSVEDLDRLKERYLEAEKATGAAKEEKPKAKAKADDDGGTLARHDDGTVDPDASDLKGLRARAEDLGVSPHGAKADIAERINEAEERG